MRITVGICDDLQEQVQFLKGLINNFCCDYIIDMICSTEAEDFLLKTQQCNPQIVFLDIDMEQMNGILLGEKIKSNNKEVLIVYITGYEKYALDAFRIRAFHYLLKPLTKEYFDAIFQECLTTISRSIQKEKEQEFTVQTKGETISFLYSDILFFEKVGHKVKIHAQYMEYSYYGNLTQLNEKLYGDTFVQCHQGYFVNVDKIKAFREKILYLHGNLQVPVSRSYTDTIKDIMAKKLFAGSAKS